MLEQLNGLRVRACKALQLRGKLKYPIARPSCLLAKASLAKAAFTHDWRSWPCLVVVANEVGTQLRRRR